MNTQRQSPWRIPLWLVGHSAGTQVLVLGVPELFTGEPLGLTRDLLMTLAWAINLALAEWLIRRHPRPGHSRTAPARAAWQQG